MVFITYAKLPVHVSENMFDHLLQQLPKYLQLKCMQFRKIQDKLRCLFGKILLLDILQKFGFERDCLCYLKYNEYNRPFISDLVDFNIAHSGHYVLCSAGADIKVGIDIEMIRYVNFGEFENTMTPAQWRSIRTSRNELKSFFSYWTIKESVIKADGRGLFIPLLEIDVLENIVHYDRQNWYITDLAIDPNYSSHLSTNVPNPDIHLSELFIT